MALIGRDTTAIVRGATEANHPAVLRVMPNSSIINGSNGPAEAHKSPTQLRTRMTFNSITNR